MQDNITTYEKTKKFVEDLQNNSDIPLIVGIDQEGGDVQRLSYLSDVKVTDIPDMYYLGKTEDENLAYQVGKLMAEELRKYCIISLIMQSNSPWKVECILKYTE